jgi:hypothetical protein
MIHNSPGSHTFAARLGLRPVSRAWTLATRVFQVLELPAALLVAAGLFFVLFWSALVEVMQ